MSEEFNINDLLKNAKEKSSSGGSIVYVSDESDIVLQQFSSNSVAKKIASIMLKILELGKVSYNIVFQKGFGPNKKIVFQTNLIYSPFEYIAPFQYYIEKENIIAWKKIVPLNSNKELLKPEFLEKNFLKIWWDICKALLTLKKINIIHNDCVLDNIGIYNGNFILFDFDGSGSPEEKEKDFDFDYSMLVKSFKFHDIDIKGMEKIKGINSLIQFVSEMRNTSLENAYLELENLKIIL